MPLRLLGLLLRLVGLLLPWSAAEPQQLDEQLGDDPAGALQRRMDLAVRAKEPQLLVPAGDYRFGNRTLLLQDATDFALVASGPVTFWFTGSDGGFLIRRCNNVTVRGASRAEPLRVDRSPPPFSQGTITQVGMVQGDGGVVMQFTLDGDSADPRTFVPSGRFEYAEVCKTWRNGSRAADGRKDSRGLPDRDAVAKGNLRACFDPRQVKETGPRQFTAPDRGAAVGDQFVMFFWRGFMYTVANSSAVITQDVAVHAAGDMAVQEMDGAGGHTYRRLQIVPRNGRLISSNADAFHSSDTDKGPLLEECHFKSMLDDFINIQTTLLFVMSVNGTRLQLISPHVSDQATDFDEQGRPVVDRWYGTTEPLSRLQPGQRLIFYDPVDFTEMGRGTARSTTTLLAAANEQDLAVAERANALYAAVAGPRHPGGNGMGHCNSKSPTPCVNYDWSSLSGDGLTKLPIGVWNSSVYAVELEQPPPPQGRPGALKAIPYLVVLESTQATGAVVSDSLFEDSLGFYGRWKSSHSRLENNTFRGVGDAKLQMQMLPSYYEGPIAVSNVTVLNNSFGVNPGSNATIEEVLERGPSCCVLKGLVQAGNTVVGGTGCQNTSVH
jgi:hypothetical protein